MDSRHQGPERRDATDANTTMLKRLVESGGDGRPAAQGRQTLCMSELRPLEVAIGRGRPPPARSGDPDARGWAYQALSALPRVPFLDRAEEPAARRRGQGTATLPEGWWENRQRV
jgi:hypothetical protein